MTNEGPIRVKATATSFRLIESLIALDGGGVSELADHLELSKSGVHNHLTTLESLGYVVREGNTFRASLQFLRDGDSVRRKKPLYQVAVDEINQLARTSGVAAGAYVLENESIVCLYSSTGEKVTPSILEAGDSFPPHCSAPGKAIMAASDDETVARLAEATGLEPCTDSSVTDLDQLQQELQRVRSRGLAFSRGEYDEELREIATSVVDTDDEVLGAIGVVSTTESMSGKRFQQDLPGLVLSSANRLAQEIIKP